MDINCLNDDCLSIIFDLIPLKQLIINRRVCKHWRQRIDNFIANERHLLYNQSINCSKKDHYFYKYKENVESLMDLNQFERCVQLMPKLTSITLNGIKANDGMLSILANNCPNITRLHLMSGEESLTFVGFKYMVEKYPLLTHLDLPNCQLDDDLIHIIATNLQNLVHLNFSTDRTRSTRMARLSRFTGQTLRKVGHKIRTLMIGESMYWDEQLIQSLTSSPAKHVTTLKIHLIKLKSLQTICENLVQLKQFYCSFNGGDINTQQNNIGCVKHLAKLYNLEVLELIDDGRNHCGVNGCCSVYTLSTLTDALKCMPNLRVIKLLDFDNWHSHKPNVDPLLSVLRTYCPNLVEFGISAGLFQLKDESYGLIAMLGVSRLTIQGDTSLVEIPQTTKRDYISNEVVINLIKNNTNLFHLTVENSSSVNEVAINAILELISTERQRQPIQLIFHNIGANNGTDNIIERPENVVLVVTRETEEENGFDFNYSDSSFESSTDSQSVNLESTDDSDDEIVILNP